MNSVVDRKTHIVVPLLQKCADSPGIGIYVASAPLDSALCTGLHLAGDEERRIARTPTTGNTVEQKTISN
jgi:hypothetical protein